MSLRKDLSPLTYTVFSVLSLSLLFTGLRLFEMLFHRKYLFDYPFLDVLTRFTYAWTADFIFFLLFNSFYIVFHLCCERFKKDGKFFFRKIFFYALNLPLVLLFFLDMQTLAVQGQLFRWSLLSAFKIEMLINSRILIKDYWYLILLFLTTLFIVLKYLPVMDKNLISKKKILPLALTYIGSALTLLYFFTFVVFKNFPSPSEYRYSGLLIRLASTIHTPHDECETSFFSKEEVLNLLKKSKPETLEQQTSKPENIILFIIENLSVKYIKSDLMPFLTGLSQRGIFLKNHLTYYRGTDLAVFSIITSQTDFNPLIHKSFTKDFLKAGYYLSFFFGDRKQSFGFPGFLKKLEISYTSRKDYLEETGRRQDIDKDGNVFEKPFLKFSAKKINNQKQPFLSFVLTNQVHYPFYCSLSTKSSYPRTKKITDCVKYVDEALRDFFEETQNSVWFNNTLFAFTADHSHTFTLTDFEDGEYFHQHNVPLVFYHPTKNLKKYQNNQVSSHMDIMPSLMDYLSLSRPNSMVYNSIFDLENKRRFFASANIKASNGFIFIEDNYLTEYSCRTKQSTTYLNDHKRKRKLITDYETKKRFDKLIKSYIQYEYTLK